MIIAEGITPQDFGLATMSRVRRAVYFNVTKSVQVLTRFNHSKTHFSSPCEETVENNSALMVKEVQEKIEEVVKGYRREEVRIGVLGSHSALEIGHGAKEEGFEVVVVCQEGREKTYTKFYKNLFDHILLLEEFVDIAKEENQERLRELNTIFVPNRSFSVYVGYDVIENKFIVPIFGNRRILRIEERDFPKNQHYLLKKAGIKTPKLFTSPEDIDRLVVIKVPEKQRKIERAFFYASSPEEYAERAEERIRK